MAIKLSLLYGRTIQADEIFIDKQGKQVFSLPIDFAEMFVNGVARVRLGFKLGYIDKTGKYIWEPSN